MLQEIVKLVTSEKRAKRQAIELFSRLLIEQVIKIIRIYVHF